MTMRAVIKNASLSSCGARNSSRPPELAKDKDTGMAGMPASDAEIRAARRLDRPSAARLYHASRRPAGWQSGYAEDCKSSYSGSIPLPASNPQAPSEGFQLGLSFSLASAA